MSTPPTITAEALALAKTIRDKYSADFYRLTREESVKKAGELISAYVAAVTQELREENARLHAAGAELACVKAGHAAHEDSARLDWLDANQGDVVWTGPIYMEASNEVLAGHPEMTRKVGKTVRAAIDAARRQGGAT